MQIKVFTVIYLDVEDHDQADLACTSINTGLEAQMETFPDGEVVGVRVDRYELVAADEAAEMRTNPTTEV